MKELQTISTLPDGQAVLPSYSTAEILVHPSGKFVYGSNRGHDSIVVFAVDETSGRLSHVQHQSTLGSIPRGFGIDPSGAYLLAGNQKSDSVADLPDRSEERTADADRQSREGRRAGQRGVRGAEVAEAGDAKALFASVDSSWPSLVAQASVPLVSPRLSPADERHFHPSRGGRTLHVDVTGLRLANHDEFVVTTERGEHLGGIGGRCEHADVRDLRHHDVAF